jgi:hypothetical protein
MKFSRAAAQSAARVSLPAADVRTPQSRAKRGNSKLQKSKFQMTARRTASQTILEFEFWTLGFPASRILARAFTGKIPIGFARSAMRNGAGLWCVTAAQLWPVFTAFPAAESDERTANARTVAARFSLGKLKSYHNM